MSNEFDTLTTDLAKPSTAINGFEGEFNEADMPPLKLGIGHSLSKATKTNPEVMGKFHVDGQPLGTSIRLTFTHVSQSYEEDCELGKGQTGGRLFDNRAAVLAMGVPVRPVAFLSAVVYSDQVGDSVLPSGASVARTTWVVRKSAYNAVVNPLRRYCAKQGHSGGSADVRDYVVSIAIKEVDGSSGSYLVPDIVDFELVPEEDREQVKALA